MRKLLADFAIVKYSRVIGQARTIDLRSNQLDPTNFESI